MEHPTTDPLIAQVAARSRPFLGGLETHIAEIVPRLGRMGFRCTILSTDNTGQFPATEFTDGVNVRRFRAWPQTRDWYFSPGLFWAVVRGRVDLVHCQGIHSFAAPLTMTAAWLTRKPYLVTFHTGGHSSSRRRSARGLQWRLLGPLLRRADALIAVSNYEIQLFSDALRLPESRFSLVQNGAELPSPATGTNLYPGSYPLIVSVARLEKYKGHHRLVAALPYLLATCPAARLVIVGTGPYESELRALAQELGVSASVDFRSYGPDQRADLAALLQRADAAALLSEYEAHPIAVMEALSVGTPVLVADTSGLRELAQAGIVSSVPLDANPEYTAQALLRVASSQAPQVRLMSWDDCAAQLADIYRRVLLERSRRSAPLALLT